ncbi:AraC family transcriptional regulator [Neobacillus niacini]|uniref:AraC family transcriptional regulator n=1 Tax=Neobacillus niacini TaxID=86668 RepID=UPI001C8D3463|nr:AraC family transcriptional regulator [Neobacillus niacini]MBY0147762.1 helix-turn-helix domain-containing protein [Neobacillus niacini]
MTNSHLKEATFIPDRTFPINIFLTKDIPLHWHDHMEWIFIKNGKARIQIDDVFVCLQKGEIAFVNSKQLHAAWMVDENTEIIAIVFNEAIVRNSGLDNTENLYFSPYLNQQLKLPNFIRKDEKHTSQIIASITNLVYEFEQKKTGYELLIKAELFRIFGLIFRNYGYLKQQYTNRYQKNYNLTALLDYLREHYHDEISVNVASKMVNLSPNHFCKVFKKVTGKTLIEYVQLLRINEAEKMLLETNLPVTEIAEKVGFGSITYFGRVFKKIKNASPSAIRSGS